MQSANEWVRLGKHLPPFLRGHHDRKAFVDYLLTVMYQQMQPDSPYYLIPGVRDVLKGLSQSAAGILLFEYALRELALHGWTLQRCRVDCGGFPDIQDSIRDSSGKPVYGTRL